MKVREEKTKQDFVQYLADHPDERFWQAVRNFTKSDFVLVADCIKPGEEDDLWGEPRDTFYLEEL